MPGAQVVVESAVGEIEEEIDVQNGRTSKPSDFIELCFVSLCSGSLQSDGGAGQGVAKSKGPGTIRRSQS